MNIPFKLKYSVGTLLFAATPALMAQVQSASMADPKGHVVVATGAADKGYDVERATSATRISAPLIETPVSIDVVDQELIRDKAILNTNELANVVSGVQPGIGYGNTSGSNFTIRGFSTNGVSYRDGYRVYDPYTPYDVGNIERVEFIKGPASVLGGASQPGGAVNTITKDALNFDYAYADIQAGSNQFYRATADMNKVLGDVSVRLNLAGDQGNSYINLESSKNYLIAPAIKWKVSNDTEVSYKGQFQKNTTNGFSNGLPLNPNVFNLSKSYTVAEPWNNIATYTNNNQVDFKTKISADWNFRQGVFYGTSQRNMNGISPDFGAYGSGSDFSRVSYSQTKDNTTNTSSQTELNGIFNTGALKHSVLAGIEFAKSVFDYYGGYGGNSTLDGNFNTFSPGLIPTLAPINAINGPGGGSNNQANSSALYLQDQIRLGGWRVLLGVRSERLTSTATSYGADASVATSTQAQTNSATTGRFGLLYMFTPKTSAYYSFSQSFAPNIGFSQDGSVFAPQKGYQNEIGVKHSIVEGLDATASLFKIIKNNMLVADPSDPNYSVAIGQAQSQGWEFGLVGQVTKGLKVVANATGLNATVTSNPSDPSVVGQQLYNAPKFSSNVWAVQDVPVNIPGKLSGGLGFVQVGERQGSISNGLMLPSYTSYDAGIFYKIDRVNLALNVKNFTNAKVFNSLEGSALWRQPGTTYLLTAGMQF
jgi:iron complex outermembrane recepter protein